MRLSAGCQGELLGIFPCISPGINPGLNPVIGPFSGTRSPVTTTHIRLELAALKPLIKTLVLPPGGLLLLGLLGLLLMWRMRRTGVALVLMSFSALWLLACNAVALLLADALLPIPAAATPTQLRSAKVQAIVVLGGGVRTHAPEFGSAQLSGASADRLHYGLWLAKELKLPVAFSGGVGWLPNAIQTVTETEVAARRAQTSYGITLRWSESQSRDTAEGARHTAALLRKDGISRVALVTHATHMPRALMEFRQTGLTVSPAPTGFLSPMGPRWHEWLPSVNGLRNSYSVLHEWLGMRVGPN